MRFLFDVGVGRAAERALLADGHDVLSMLDEAPSATDSTILDLAVAQDRISVTVDLDFGEMVARRHLAHRGVVVLRMEDALAAGKASAVRWIVATAGNRLHRHLAVFQAGRLRIGHPWEGA